MSSLITTYLELLTGHGLEFSGALLTLEEKIEIILTKKGLLTDLALGVIILLLPQLLDIPDKLEK